MSRDTTTTSVVSRLNGRERGFVDKVAEYYHSNDGMPLERGRVLGYLMICDPPEQTADEIADAIGADRTAVDRMIDQLVPSAAHDGVFRRTDLPDGNYSVRMLEGRWADQVKAVFAGIPDFHQVVKFGLGVLQEAPSQRRRRLVLMEQFLRFLSAEIPAMWDRYEQAKRAAK